MDYIGRPHDEEHRQTIGRIVCSTGIGTGSRIGLAATPVSNAFRLRYGGWTAHRETTASYTVPGKFLTLSDVIDIGLELSADIAVTDVGNVLRWMAGEFGGPQ